MAIVVKKYLGSDGDVLIPIGDGDNNSKNLISAVTGQYYIAVIENTASIQAGNPIGLLLALTYSATP